MRKVRDYFSLKTPGVDLVTPDTSIERIIQVVAQNTTSRAVYVVDWNEKLIGMISVKEVLGILGAKYARKRTLAVLHDVLSKTAADIMRAVEAVSPEDDLEQALKIAVIHNMEDIPVIENGKVIGNLDCFELIQGILERHQAEHPGSHDEG
jgi:CBS domain-containing protein